MSKYTKYLVEKNKKRRRIREACHTVILSMALTLCFSIPVALNASDRATYINQEYIDYVYSVCEQKNLCPELVIAVIETESAGRHDVISSHGCIGLMQLDPRYFSGNLFDWRNNIDQGTDYLLELFQKYNDAPTVLTAFNTGEYSNATRYAVCSGKGNGYSEKVLKRTEELERIRENN